MGRLDVLAGVARIAQTGQLVSAGTRGIAQGSQWRCEAKGSAPSLNGLIAQEARGTKV